MSSEISDAAEAEALAGEELVQEDEVVIEADMEEAMPSQPPTLASISSACTRRCVAVAPIAAIPSSPGPPLPHISTRTTLPPRQRSRSGRGYAPSCSRKGSSERRTGK